MLKIWWESADLNPCTCLVLSDNDTSFGWPKLELRFLMRKTYSYQIITCTNLCSYKILDQESTLLHIDNKNHLVHYNSYALFQGIQGMSCYNRQYLQRTFF